jgi:tetratricopeptide (TPR) repeat protein
MLPGLGNRPGLDGVNRGDLAARTPAERRDDLNDRLSNREDWYDNRADIREDWHDWNDDYHHHGDWHHGYWHGNASDWWHHMWDDHTALMAFGTTAWGINRAAYTFGYWGYENPYYYESYPVGGDVVLDYSEPIFIETAPAVESAPVVQPVQVATTTVAAETVSPGLREFEAARTAFYQGNYAAALASTDKALASMPTDAVLHEFRALVLFAQGKYKDAAAGLYAVLSVGPGWDATTLVSLYPNIDTYTQHLRALEKYARDNLTADARFVLAYHYLTLGHKDAAVYQLQQLQKLTPNDRLAKELLVMAGGPEAAGITTSAETTAAPSPASASIKAADLTGGWNAAGQAGTTFALEITADGNFTWTYAHGGKKETVKGVYALDGNVLAMEPTTGGVMLAEISKPQAGSFDFRLLGAPDSDQGLKFRRGS